MDDNLAATVTRENDRNKNDANETEMLRYSKVNNGLSNSQHSVEDVTHFHACEINHEDERSKTEIQADENRSTSPDVKFQTGENHLDIKSVTSESETLKIDENPKPQCSESESDINIYDDTKPRRLRLSKSMKQDESYSGAERLMQGIDALISPDDQPHRSPTRRKGVSGASFQLTRDELDMTDNAKTIDLEIIPGIHGFQHFEYPGKQRGENERTDCKLGEKEAFQDESVTTSPNDIEKGYASDTASETGINDSIQRTESKQNSYKVAAHTEDEAQLTEQNDDNVVNEYFIQNESITAEHADINDRQPDAYSKRRKSSTDMLIHRYEPNMLVPRKTSAEANLESERRYDSDQEIIDTQTQRKRRVSFGMVAYVRRGDLGKNETSPLNDEVRLPNAKERTVTSKIVKKATMPIQSVNGEAKATKERIPMIHVTEDEENEANQESSQFYLSNGNENIPRTKQGCDNLAYITDENEENDGNEFSFYLNAIDERGDEKYDRNELQEEKLRMKKISTQSLPVGVSLRDTRRLSWSSDDISMPKGILKNKTTSSESLASSAGSANDKRFKVRKDSIALFTDKHGQVGLLEIKKDSKSWKERLSIKRIWSKRKEIIKEKKTHLFVCGLFSCILAFVIVGLHLHSIHKENLAVARKVFFDAKSRQLHLYDTDGNDHISGMLGLHIPKWLLPVHCYEDYERIHDRTCLIWKKFGTLNIRFVENAVKCYNISWNMEPGVNHEDCFDIGNKFWYGPSNSSGNNWPISFSGFTFDTNSVKHFDSGTFEFVTEYYWLATSGAAIYVDSRFPLRVKWNQANNGKLCLSVLKSGDFYDTDTAQSLNINYVVCNSDDILKTHKFIGERVIQNLQEIPDMALMTSPHWSTDSQLKKSIVNETSLIDLTKQLKRHNFNCSTIDLDGQWESKIGDFTFSKVRFPNMTKTFQAVESAGCHYSLSLFPYFDLNSRNFPEGLSRELFIKSIGKQVPALIKWQFGVGAMLDVSNSSARDWFTNKIRQLKSLYGINTFRFAYGNSFWLPHKPVFSQEKLSPNKVKNMFSDLFSSFGDIVIESTSRSQHIAGFIGIPSSVINHRQSKCLNNIIADALNLGHLGYPLVMSDGFELQTSGQAIPKRPSRDLFIRWMQLASFFPAMRYTVKPWDYDKEVVSIARNLSKFHREVVVPEIKKIESEILQGKPFIRPLWWRNPKDSNTFKIDDQFLLGDKYLVAPVLCEGTEGIAERDIYVPKGIWRDIISNTIIPGPKWIYGYQINQNEIPYFKQEELHFSVQ